MIDLLILYDVPGWAYHARAQALQRHAPSDFRVRIASFDRYDGQEQHHARQLDLALGDAEPDICFVLYPLDTAFVRRALAERGWSTRLIASWNNGWPRRRELFPRIREIADHTVVNNLDYWVKSGMPARTTPISNGVCHDTFQVSRDLSSRPPKVLWCGSEIHRQIKGYDDYVVPLGQRLERAGIDHDFRLVDSRGNGKWTPRKMAEWYNGGTVLVCASSTEGTPNTALEAASCGCTVVSTPVGNMPELLRHGENGLLVERDVDALHQGVVHALHHAHDLARQLHRDIQHWSWERRAQDFFRLFKDIFQEPGTTRVSRGQAPATD